MKKAKLTLFSIFMAFSFQICASVLYTFEGTIRDSIQTGDSELRNKYSYLEGTYLRFSVKIGSAEIGSITDVEAPYKDYSVELVASNLIISNYGDFIGSKGSTQSSKWHYAAAGYDFGYHLSSGMRVVSDTNQETSLFFGQSSDACFVNCDLKQIYFGNWNVGDNIFFRGSLISDKIVANYPNFDVFESVQFYSEDMRLISIKTIPIPPAIWLFGSAFLGLASLKYKNEF